MADEERKKLNSCCIIGKNIGELHNNFVKWDETHLGDVLMPFCKQHLLHLDLYIVIVLKHTRDSLSFVALIVTSLQFWYVLEVSDSRETAMSVNLDADISFRTYRPLHFGLSFIHVWCVIVLMEEYVFHFFFILS